MNQAAVEALLTKHIGLDVASIGTGLIARAVETRMRACAITDLDCYVKTVESDPAELRALIDSVVVSESWFFRDLRPFLRLQRFVREEWKPQESRRLRVLSIPCARGEEAYSLAIALLDAGLSAEHFTVEAVDISEAVLQQARTGVFRNSAFRTEMVGNPAHYLATTESGFAVRPEVRRLVHFRQGNLLDSELLKDEPAFDAIFCRNLLIYLTQEAKETAVAKLSNLLTSEGLLFVGHAEALTILREHFVADADVSSFAYCKPANLPVKAGLQPVDKSLPLPTPTKKAAKQPAPTALRALPKKPAPASPVETSQTLIGPVETNRAAMLAEASQLADRKDYAKAAQVCQKLLATTGPDAGVYLLLGMIELGAGHPTEAEAFLHKVAYLDSTNVEALLALASLARQRGDLEEAERRSRRADRARQRESSKLVD
jgi:chemotaxis protein methyltransferase WspC